MTDWPWLDSTNLPPGPKTYAVCGRCGVPVYSDMKQTHERWHRRADHD